MSLLEDRIREPWLRDVLAAWQGWRGADGTVLRTSLDPSALPPSTVQFLFLYERIDGRWRCSLSGSGIGQRAGYDPTNRWLDEMLQGRALDSRNQLFNDAIERGRACIYAGWLAVVDRPHVRFERLLLPVIGRSGLCDTLFGAVAFLPVERGVRPPSDVIDPVLVAWEI